MTHQSHRTVRLAGRLIAALAATWILTCSVASAQGKQEVYILPWPDDAGWRPQEKQEAKGMTFVEFLKGKETFENWSEIGSITRIAVELQPGQSVPLGAVVHDIFAEQQGICPEATLAILDQDTTAKHPWIIYAISCPKYTNGKVESNVYQALVGDQAVYVCQRGIKTPSVSDEKRAELVDFFKRGRLAYE